MSQLDLFYRAFREYREGIQKERESKLLRDALVQDDAHDKVNIIQVTCHVEEDWVEAIEKGLVYIGRAIDEDRQFIRSEGEVQPIEKVRHVSRETAEHLARHSNLITRKPAEGENLLPERLYTVERLNNYAVYENRFLYMVLCRLNEFISLRYNRIVRETNTYRGEVSLRKSIVSGKRRLECEIELKDFSDDDPYLRSRNQLGAVLDRLERMQRTVYFYLHTPLMLEVAKADKLKPPITKTNVLRMDKNFKEVVALYEFLLAYTKDGFTVTKQECAVDFTAKDVAEEFAEPILILSFLAYEHGLDLSAALRAEYEAEEIRRREAADRAFLEQLENVRNRLRAREIAPEEYIVLLEKRNQDLEKEIENFDSVKESLQKLGEENEILQGQIQSFQEEIGNIHAEHTAELQRRDETEEALRRQIDEDATAHAAALVEFNRAKEEEIRQLVAQNESEIHARDERIRENDRERAQLQGALQENERKYALLHARLTALRNEHGLLTDTEDYTSEEAFTQLEHELEVFSAFVSGKWKSAKQLLRKEILGCWFRALKDKIGKKSSSNNRPKGMTCALEGNEDARPNEGNEDARPIEGNEDGRPNEGNEDARPNEASKKGEEDERSGS